MWIRGTEKAAVNGRCFVVVVRVFRAVPPVISRERLAGDLCEAWEISEGFSPVDLEVNVESGFDGCHFLLKLLHALADVKALFKFTEADCGHPGQVVNVLLDRVFDVVQTLVEIFLGEFAHAYSVASRQAMSNVDNGDPAAAVCKHDRRPDENWKTPGVDTRSDALFPGRFPVLGWGRFWR